MGGREQRWEISFEEGGLHLSVIHYMNNTAALQPKTASLIVQDRERDRERK